MEIKTSSSRRGIFGNRSYTQPARTKKEKSGYYLAVNFDKAAPPSVRSVRFGWLDHADWLGQAAASGQQARLRADALRHKLLSLPLFAPPVCYRQKSMFDLLCYNHAY